MRKIIRRTDHVRRDIRGDSIDDQDPGDAVRRDQPAEPAPDVRFGGAVPDKQHAGLAAGRGEGEPVDIGSGWHEATAIRWLYRHLPAVGGHLGPAYVLSGAGHHRDRCGDEGIEGEVNAKGAGTPP